MNIETLSSPDELKKKRKKFVSEKLKIDFVNFIDWKASDGSIDKNFQSLFFFSWCLKRRSQSFQHAIYIHTLINITEARVWCFISDWLEYLTAAGVTLTVLGALSIIVISKFLTHGPASSNLRIPISPLYGVRRVFRPVYLCNSWMRLYTVWWSKLRSAMTIK